MIEKAIQAVDVFYNTVDNEGMTYFLESNRKEEFLKNFEPIDELPSEIVSFCEGLSAYYSGDFYTVDSSDLFQQAEEILSEFGEE